MVTDRNDFHERYTLCKQFFKNFELRCGSQESVKRLRKSPKTISFHGSWPLHSYFNSVSKHYTSLFEENLKISSSYQQVFISIDNIFNESVFIDKLSHKFWMLSIKFLISYINFIYNQSKSNVAANSSLLQTQESVNEGDHNNNNKMTSSIHGGVENDDLTNSVTGSLSLNDSKNTTIIQKKLIQELSILSKNLNEQIIIKHYLRTLCRENQPSANLNEHEFNLSVTSPDETVDYKNILQNSLKSIYQLIENKQEEMIKYLKITLSETSMSELNKTTKSLPRLYRNTNRDAPSSCTDFMMNSFIPLEELSKNMNDILHFKEISETELKSEYTQQVITYVISYTSPKYYNLVKELLSQVKKIEDSFLKLQERRKNKKQPQKNNDKNKRQSDDDKIRVQLVLDIEFYLNKCESMGVKIDESNSNISRKEYISSDVTGKLDLIGLYNLKEVVGELKKKLEEKNDS